MFDAGTGLSRLADPLFREMVARSNRALVLLGSCGHGRLAGLPWLPAFLAGLEVTVGVPPGGEAALDKLLDRPFLPDGRDAWKAPLAGLDIVELKPGKNRVGREKVEVSVLEGPEPTCAFRVREVVYATGCPARAETAQLAARASLLIHDASFDAQDLEAEPSIGERRSTASACARLAQEASVQDLLLAHVNPDYEPGRVERLQFEATAVFPRAVIATDMACLKLTGVPEEEPEEGDRTAADVVEGEDGVASPEGATTSPAPDSTADAEAEEGPAAEPRPATDATA